MYKNVRKISKKTISLSLIFIILFFLADALFASLSEVQADSYRYDYNGSNLNEGTYPGFKASIDALRAKHPSWKFKIMETYLDWDQTIVAEKGNKSLIQGKGGSWVYGSYDNAWDQASEGAIRYYMDPRNFLSDNSNLFQFLQLSYTEISDENLYNALNGTFLYTMDYARQINSACRNKNINPIYVVARILQEQGNPSTSRTFRMWDSSTNQYYYNLFNIGATGAGDEVVTHALDYAKSKGWTSIEACLNDGISFLSDYIGNKQDTLYLNKFDVESYNGVYWKQYMQNIEAPKSEASKMYNMMSKANLMDNLTFIIPVFYNMPVSACLSPDRTGDIGPENIKVKQGHTQVVVRNAENGNQIALLNYWDEGALSIQRFSSGWHKIVFKSGDSYRTGYTKFNSTYWEQVADEVNCSETMTISSDGVKLYAGPNEVEMKDLTRGQIVTRVLNTGKYNINGSIWDRISLADGTQGFVKRDNLNSENESEIYTVRANGGLALKDAPAGNLIRYLADGLKVTRRSIGQNTVSLNGTPYYWDEVVTPDGAIGYVARNWLYDKNGKKATGDTTAQGDYKETAIKVVEDSSEIKMEPNVTISNIKSTDGSITKITKPDGTEVTDGNAEIGTGFKITRNGKEYTAIKIGDLNGDGKINSGDLLKIRKKLLDATKLEGVYYTAGDLNGDGNINSGDLLKIRKYLLNATKIEVK